MTRSPRIAVVGAGLGGLACARVLQTHGRAVTVLEHEGSPDARTQGGTLDVHATTGQVALRRAGLLGGFRALARPEGQEMRMLDAAGAVLAHRRPEDGEEEKPEIDRGDLRALLLDSLDAGTVAWGRGVAEVGALPDGTSQVLFRDGSREVFDLVVGADGAWSRVRPALSDARPRYTGVVFVEIGFEDVDVRHAGIARLVGDGMMVAKGACGAMFVQRNGNGRVRAYIAFRAPQDWAAAAGLGPDLADGAAVRAHLLAMFGGWDASLLALLRDHDGALLDRPLFVLPVPHTWDHVPGVTLLGDAAHLMPPAGLGANLALLDGTDLALALLSGPTLDDAVRAYEELMIPRGAEAAAACASMLDHITARADRGPSWSGVAPGVGATTGAAT